MASPRKRRRRRAVTAVRRLQVSGMRPRRPVRREEASRDPARAPDRQPAPPRRSVPPLELAPRPHSSWRIYAGCYEVLGCGLLRRRDSHPQRRSHFPRTSVIVGYRTMTLPIQLAVSSPNAPRRVLLFVLFNSKARSSLVNQQASFFSALPSFSSTSSVTALEAEFRVPLEILGPEVFRLVVVRCQEHGCLRWLGLQVRLQLGRQPDRDDASFFICSSGARSRHSRRSAAPAPKRVCE